MLPIDSRGTQCLAEERPQIAVDRKQYIYYAGTQSVPSNAAPRLVNVPHSISVHANVPKGGADGVLFSMGGVDGGFVFYVQDGKLTYGTIMSPISASKYSPTRSFPRAIISSAVSSSLPVRRILPRERACRRPSPCLSMAHP